MAVDIVMNFFDVKKRSEIHDESVIGGYNFADYFSDDGLARAEAAETVAQAERILDRTFKGADNLGVSLRWHVVLKNWHHRAARKRAVLQERDYTTEHSDGE